MENRKEKWYKIEFFDNLVLFILSIFGITTAILVYVGKIIPFEGVEENPQETKLFALIILLLSLLALIFSVYKIISEINNRKKSVFFSIYDDYKEDKIVEKLEFRGLKSEKINVIVNNENELISISYKAGQGNFCAIISKIDIYLSYEFEDEVFEKMSEEEIENCEILTKDVYFRTVKIKKDEFYNKYVAFINDYDYLVN